MDELFGLLFIVAAIAFVIAAGGFVLVWLPPILIALAIFALPVVNRWAAFIYFKGFGIMSTWRDDLEVKKLVRKTCFRWFYVAFAALPFWGWLAFTDYSSLSLAKFFDSEILDSLFTGQGFMARSGRILLTYLPWLLISVQASRIAAWLLKRRIIKTADLLAGAGGEVQLLAAMDIIINDGFREFHVDVQSDHATSFEKWVKNNINAAILRTGKYRSEFSLWKKRAEGDLTGVNTASELLKACHKVIQQQNDLLSANPIYLLYRKTEDTAAALRPESVEPFLRNREWAKLNERLRRTKADLVCMASLANEYCSLKNDPNLKKDRRPMSVEVAEQVLQLPEFYDEELISERVRLMEEVYKPDAWKGDGRVEVILDQVYEAAQYLTKAMKSSN